MAARKRKKNHRSRPRANAPRPASAADSAAQQNRAESAAPAADRRPAAKRSPARRNRRRVREVEPFTFREARKARRREDGNGGEILYRVLLVGMIAAALFFIASTFFEVKRIEVTGTTKYLPEQVAAISGIQTGDRLLFINRFEIWENIRAELPYVKKMQVRQRFPNTVVLEITERRPAAKLENNGISYLIDEEAVLLEYTALGDQYRLPVIHGAAPTEVETGREVMFEDELMLDSLKNILTELVATDWITEIVDIDLERIYDISFNYGNRYTVLLGDASELPYKLAVFEEVLSRLHETDQGVIDLSTPSTVNFRPYTT
ncbi:MAG: FtsQ-type POTRA domain-containing protein [Ruminococcaceae bacterium]|nr:FtsQ-type POTRA domain-containing protein [Oscillospiraceae bacterium]